MCDWWVLRGLLFPFLLFSSLLFSLYYDILVLACCLVLSSLSTSNSLSPPLHYQHNHAVAREWISDEEATGCMDCGAEFTFTRRRHHCRNCGGIFCGNCTTKKMAILSLGHVNKVRVCENCFAEAQGA